MLIWKTWNRQVKNLTNIFSKIKPVFIVIFDNEKFFFLDFKSPEEGCVKILPKEETESCKKEKLGENEVNLFEFVASLNNSEVPCGLVEDTDLNSTTDKSDEISTESAVEVNLLEYVANLNKMQLPGNVSAIVNSDFKTVASQEKVECANKEPEKVEQFKDYRSQPAVVELSSSEDSESDSSSSSDSDSSDSSGENAAVVNIDDKDEENEEETPQTNKNRLKSFFLVNFLFFNVLIIL